MRRQAERIVRGARSAAPRPGYGPSRVVRVAYRQGVWHFWGFPGLEIALLVQIEGDDNVIRYGDALYGA